MFRARLPDLNDFPLSPTELVLPACSFQDMFLLRR